MTVPGLANSSLASFDGENANQLAGTWVIRLTDFYLDGKPPVPAPPQENLNFWTLNLTTAISNTGFGNDKQPNNIVNPPIPLAVTTGVNVVQPTIAPASPTVGIGASVSLAFDTSAGNFATASQAVADPIGPHAGTLYMAYTTGAGSNTNVWLAYSNDDGVTWADATIRNGVPAPINDDSIADNFTEGTRSQFEPNVAVDPVTGTVVATWYDARNDAANARVTEYVATSTDRGMTFSPQVWVNPTKTAENTIDQATVALQPVPGNLLGAGTSGSGRTRRCWPTAARSRPSIPRTPTPTGPRSTRRP